MSAALHRTEPSLPIAPPAGRVTASLRDLRLALAQDTPANPSSALLAVAFHAVIDRLLGLLITLAARFAAGESIPSPSARQAPAPRPATTPTHPPLAPPSPAWWRAPFRWCFAPNHPARPVAPANREHGALRIATSALPVIACTPASACTRRHARAPGICAHTGARVAPTIARVPAVPPSPSPRLIPTAVRVTSPSLRPCVSDRITRSRPHASKMGNGNKAFPRS